FLPGGLQFPNDRVFLRAAKPSKNRATIFAQVRSDVPGAEGDGGQRMTTSVLGYERTDTSFQQPLLEVCGLTTEFRTRDGLLRAVNDVSFSLQRGRVLAVIGESGCGKTALLRTILGIQPRTARISGAVQMRGTDLLTLSPKERERIRGDWLAM